MNRLLLLVCGVALAGCGDALDELLQSLKTGQHELSDDDAFRHLRKNRQAAPETDVASVMKIIDAESTGGEMDLADPAVESLLRRVVHARTHIDESTFDLVPFEDFGLRTGPPVEKSNCAYDVPDFDSLHDEYLVPGVEKIPVRNQGGRGTCAAFAAIGSIEYAVLNPGDGEEGNPSLPTFDLSEQRFYWLSKDECQSSGCECPGCSEGSWYGVGFDASADASDLDIPLETDCPYNNQPGDNDTQNPQKSSCEKGAVKVEEVETWCGIDDLIDLLHRGYAVPYASPLSGNWEGNDGLVTKGDFDGEGGTVHAGGHAYLIVGYKQLPDMPEEGGICFVVKNSWGAGWGVNGYACQTLAWMKAVTFDGFIAQPQPVALRINVRDDLAAADELPPDNEEAEEEEAVDIPDEIDPPPDDEDVLPPPEPDVDPDPEPAPEPEPEPEPPAFEEALLLGPNETYYRVQISERDGIVFVKGLLLSDKGESKSLQVRKSGDELSYKGDVVGRLRNGEMCLCTDEWAALCSVRYRKSDKQLYIQFRDDDLRVPKPDEYSDDRGEWLSLGLAGREFGIFVPTDLSAVEFLTNPKTFVRLGSAEPARLSLKKVTDSTDFMIKLSGQQVGVFKATSPTSSSLCSGNFSDRCRVLGKNSVFVLPSNRGTRRER